jgi:tRNA(Ile2) C34 agmatinyltransferase TiaS
MSKNKLSKISQFALNLYAANCVDEALEFEKMEKEIQELRAKISSSKPICPFCLVEMKAIEYKGYYDSFPMWECRCDKFEKPDYTAHGAYA